MILNSKKNVVSSSLGVAFTGGIGISISVSDFGLSVCDFPVT